MKFADIPSHDAVKEQLRTLVDNDRMPHALLLEGPQGIGKMMMARALVQYIHCTNRTPDGDSCGHCPACLQNQSFNQIDTYYSYPVIKAGRTNVVSDDYAAEWRKFLTDSPFMEFSVWQQALGKADAQPIIYVDESAAILHRLSFTSHAAKYMVVVMWLPEKMNEACANKLLKIIEEPHPDTLFILVSNEPAKILPTIYSRLQRIEMKRLPDEIVASWLINNCPIDPATATRVAHLSQGSILGAMKRLESDSEREQHLQMFMTLMRSAYKRDVVALKKWSDDVAALKREGVMRFLTYCERLIGENYIFNLRNPQLVYLDSDEEKFSVNFARFINERNVEQLRRLVIEANSDVAANANAKMVLFDVALKAIMLIKQ